MISGAIHCAVDAENCTNASVAYLRVGEVEDAQSGLSAFVAEDGAARRECAEYDTLSVQVLQSSEELKCDLPQLTIRNRLPDECFERARFETLRHDVERAVNELSCTECAEAVLVVEPPEQGCDCAELLPCVLGRCRGHDPNIDGLGIRDPFAEVADLVAEVFTFARDSVRAFDDCDLAAHWNWCSAGGRLGEFRFDAHWGPSSPRAAPSEWRGAWSNIHRGRGNQGAP